MNDDGMMTADPCSALAMAGIISYESSGYLVISGCYHPNL